MWSLPSTQTMHVPANGNNLPSCFTSELSILMFPPPGHPLHMPSTHTHVASSSLQLQLQHRAHPMEWPLPSGSPKASKPYLCSLCLCVWFHKHWTIPPPYHALTGDSHLNQQGHMIHLYPQLPPKNLARKRLSVNSCHRNKYVLLRHHKEKFKATLGVFILSSAFCNIIRYLVYRSRSYYCGIIIKLSFKTFNPI